MATGEKKLKIPGKGIELINTCRDTCTYSFDSIQKLRLFESGVLNCPTDDPYLDNYIKVLLKEGYLEEVSIVEPKRVDKSVLDKIMKEASKCSK
jgi:hypothetical protein